MLVTLRQGLVPCLQLLVDLLPTLINHPGIIGNEVTAGGASVAIAMIVEPLDRLSRAAFFVDKLRVLFCLTLGQAGGGLHVEPCPSDQIPGQDLLWHIRDHYLFDEPGFALGQRLCRTRTFMDIQIVQDHHIAVPEARRELRADIGVESGTIHGPLDDPGSNKLIAAQAGNEGLRSPLAEGGVSHEPLSLQAAPAQGCHLGLYARFIDEDESRRLATHEGLAMFAPCLAGCFDVSAFFLRRQQRFFYSRSRPCIEAWTGSTGRPSSHVRPPAKRPDPAW